MNTAYDILQRVFGHHHFRANQEEAGQCDFSAERFDDDFTPGGWKVTVLSASLFGDGRYERGHFTTLPFMHDQITALSAFGIKATMISSMQSPSEIQEVCKRVVMARLNCFTLRPTS